MFLNTSELWLRRFQKRFKLGAGAFHLTKSTRVILLPIADVLAFVASYLLAFLIGSSFGSGRESASVAAKHYFEIFPAVFLILSIVKLVALYVFSIYKILLEYFSLTDIKRFVLALAAGTFAAVTVAQVSGMELQNPVVIFSYVFDALFVIGLRFAWTRLFHGREDAQEENGRSRHRQAQSERKKVRRVMIVGSGQAAADLIAEMQHEEGMRPEIIIDDDKDHEGGLLLGVEVARSRKDIRLLARRRAIDEILIAKPAAERRQTSAILRECIKTRCRIRMLPPHPERPLRERADVSASLNDLVKPTVSDLLGRDRPRIDYRGVADLVRGRVVLVTGGAGAYGSELCRQIMRNKPRRLIALDLDEDGLTMLTSLIEVENGVMQKNTESEFRTVIASIRDAETMRRVFSAFRPHLVFHAAELKQAPLIQMNPREAFLTNVVGLQTAADLSDEFSAEIFILASTVSARNPSTVASACKRVAEMYAYEKNGHSHTTYASVRFPNLLEGRANVISLFERQIARGGPLTVHDKDLQREYVGAEEAALLTLQAASLADGGETFVLGPGELIEIRELAEAMVRLSGAIPYEEIDIVLTQPRVGEHPQEDDGRGNIPVDAVSEHLWLSADSGATQLPHWSELWYQDPQQMNDAAVVAMLQKIFPASYSAPPPSRRGARIETE
jgi:FlaA1/EpsC-like NDP-sugar epimerase